MSNYKDFSNNVLSLHRYSKRAIAVISDAGLCIFCTWLAFTLRGIYWLQFDKSLILFEDYNYTASIISIILAIPIFWLFGLYRTIFRYTNFSIIITILMSSFVYGLLYFSAIGVYGINNVPGPIGVIQPMLLFFAIISSRSVKNLLLGNFGLSNSFNKRKVIVYGAGDVGRQLVAALENSPEFKVV